MYVASTASFDPCVLLAFMRVPRVGNDIASKAVSWSALKLVDAALLAEQIYSLLTHRYASYEEDRLPLLRVAVPAIAVSP